MKTNDKVICINSRKGPGYHRRHFPNGYIIKGRIYVVESTEFFTFNDTSPNPILCLNLVGVPAIDIPTNLNVPWAAFRFRLLSDLRAEAALAAKAKQKQISKTK